VGKLLDGLFQCGVFLADDFVKVGRLHPGFLKLRRRPAGFSDRVFPLPARIKP
jgi:hypothetical protein